MVVAVISFFCCVAVISYSLWHTAVVKSCKLVLWRANKHYSGPARNEKECSTPVVKHIYIYGIYYIFFIYIICILYVLFDFWLDFVLIL